MGITLFLDSPSLCSQIHPAVQLCTPHFNTGQKDQDARTLQQSQSTGENTAQLAPGTGTTTRQAASAVAQGWPRPVHAPASFTDSESASWSETLHKRGKHLNSKKTTVAKSAYVLFCNKYLQVSVCEQNARQNRCIKTCGADTRECCACASLC